MAAWVVAPQVVMVIMVPVVVVVLVMVMGSEGMVKRERRQAVEPCVCVPNTQCYSEDAGWWHCPNFGELCCPEDYTAGPCSCHNFFECSEGSVQWAASSRCEGKDQVCCNRDESIPDRRPVSPPADQRPPGPSHLDVSPTTTTTTTPPVQGGPCETIGTRRGTCLPYSQCQNQLEEPVRLLTIEQFLHNYGCGANRDGDVRVCCPM